MNKQIALSIEQMKHLVSLGIDTSNASLCWVKEPNSGERSLGIHDEYCYEMGCLEPIPAFTLQDLIELMPSSIQLSNAVYNLSIFPNNLNLITYEKNTIVCLFSKKCNSLIDACIDMLSKLIENGYLNQKANNHDNRNEI